MKSLAIQTLLFLGILGAAVPAYAAQILVSTTPTAPVAGETFTIEARLATEGDQINAAEGTFVLEGAAVLSVSTGGSAFSLWPVVPRYAPGTREIEFAGGVPSAIGPGEDVMLFSIEARAPASGSYALALKAARAFKADGKGSVLPVSGFSKKVAVASSSQPVAQKSKDSTAPQFVSVEVGQDPALFDGQKFVTFFATDDNSGVTSYEVKEGWFGLYKPADRYYVLEDQSQGSSVWVRVTDAAGNSVTEKIASIHTGSTSLFMWGGILLVLVLGVWYLLARKKRHHPFS